MNVTIESVIERITELLSNKNQIIIAIDGRSGAGKTTFASELEKILGCNVIHIDDFFLRPEQRTPKRLDSPGENIDHERFLAEVLIPLKNGEKFEFKPFDCHLISYKDEVTVEPNRITVIEGSYCCHKNLWEYYDLHIFLDVDRKTQKQRIIKRNGENAEMFFTKWIPLEEKYFEVFGIKEKCEIS